MYRIKIGEYVRTKSGFIGKVISRQGGYGLYYELNVKKQIQKNHIEGWVHEDYIETHNEDIKELIKKDDFVNGKRVISIHEDDIKYLNPKETRRKKLIMLGDMCSLGLLEDLKIETILTKEQYEMNCFKVGDTNA